MRYGKVTVHKKDGTQEHFRKVWTVREIVDSAGDPAKRICFFNGTEAVIKDDDIERVEYR